jgi:hypothetical protein
MKVCYFNHEAFNTPFTEEEKVSLFNHYACSVGIPEKIPMTDILRMKASRLYKKEPFFKAFIVDILEMFHGADVTQTDKLANIFKSYNPTLSWESIFSALAKECSPDDLPCIASACSMSPEAIMDALVQMPSSSPTFQHPQVEKIEMEACPSFAAGNFPLGEYPSIGRILVLWRLNHP